MPSMMWFYKDGDQENGPIGKDDLQRLIHSKKISLETLVRREDMNQWRPLSEFVRSKKKDPEEASSDAAAKPSVKQTAPNSASVAGGVPKGSYEDEIPFRFKGAGGEYFKIWIVNVLLSMVTFGIYSAWAKVRRKQYFYGNTHVAGASFRYLADPVKILKGRLIVFFFFLGYSVIADFLPILGAIMSLALLVFLPWLVVRSLTFNARNSSLRNIRFNFTGTYGGAATEYILLPMAGALTLGILSPYIYFRQKKFMVENTSYGTTYFKFNATGNDYYRMVFTFFIPLLIFVVSAAAIGYFYEPLAILVMMTLYLYALAYFSVKSSNLLYNSSVLADHKFSATMEIKDYALIMFTNTLATVFTLGLFHPFAKVRALRYKINHLSILPGGDLDQFVAAEIEESSALGDEAADFMDFDFGL